MKAWGAAEGKWKLPSWFLEKDLPWWREWGAAKPKRELPSWFLEEDLPWWSGSIHPCDEEFVDQWFARLSEEKGKGSGRGPQAKGKGKGSEKRQKEWQSEKQQRQPQPHPTLERTAHRPQKGADTSQGMQSERGRS